MNTPQQLVNKYRAFWQECLRVFEAPGKSTDVSKINHSPSGNGTKISVDGASPLLIPSVANTSRKHEKFDLFVCFDAFIENGVLVGASTSLTYVHAKQTGQRTTPGPWTLHLGLRFDYDPKHSAGHPRFHLQHSHIDLPESFHNAPKRIDMPRIPIAPMAFQDAIVMVAYDCGKPVKKLRTTCRDQALPSFPDMLSAAHWYPDSR